MKIKRNSWHYRLYNTYASNYVRPHDICEYMRGVFLGGILAILITFLLVAVGCSAIDFILWAYFNLFVGSVEIQTFGIVFLMMMVFVGLFYTFSILENHKYDMQDTFVYQSYNAVKNKMCFRVDVED